MVVKASHQMIRKKNVPPDVRPMEGIYTPRTDLGRKLWEIRARIVASGEPLLDWDEIDKEVAERRGEVDEER